MKKAAPKLGAENLGWGNVNKISRVGGAKFLQQGKKNMSRQIAKEIENNVPIPMRINTGSGQCNSC